MEYYNAMWRAASAGSLKSLEKAQLKVARAIAHSQRGQPGPKVLSECNLTTLACVEEESSLSLSPVQTVKVHRRLLSFFQQLFKLNRNSPAVYLLVSLSVCIL